MLRIVAACLRAGSWLQHGTVKCAQFGEIHLQIPRAPSNQSAWSGLQCADGDLQQTKRQLQAPGFLSVSELQVWRLLTLGATSDQRPHRGKKSTLGGGAPGPAAGLHWMERMGPSAE